MEQEPNPSDYLASYHFPKWEEHFTLDHKVLVVYLARQLLFKTPQEVEQLRIEDDIFQQAVNTNVPTPLIRFSLMELINIYVKHVKTPVYMAMGRLVPLDDDPYRNNYQLNRYVAELNVFREIGLLKDLNFDMVKLLNHLKRSRQRRSDESWGSQYLSKRIPPEIQVDVHKQSLITNVQHPFRSGTFIKIEFINALEKVKYDILYVAGYLARNLPPIILRETNPSEANKLSSIIGYLQDASLYEVVEPLITIAKYFAKPDEAATLPEERVQYLEKAKEYLEILGFLQAGYWLGRELRKEERKLKSPDKPRQVKTPQRLTFPSGPKKFDSNNPQPKKRTSTQIPAAIPLFDESNFDRSKSAAKMVIEKPTDSSPVFDPEFKLTRLAAQRTWRTRKNLDLEDREVNKIGAAYIREYLKQLGIETWAHKKPKIRQLMTRIVKFFTIVGLWEEIKSQQMTVDLREKLTILMNQNPAYEITDDDRKIYYSPLAAALDEAGLIMIALRSGKHALRLRQDEQEE